MVGRHIHLTRAALKQNGGGGGHDTAKEHDTAEEISLTRAVQDDLGFEASAHSALWGVRVQSDKRA